MCLNPIMIWGQPKKGTPLRVPNGELETREPVLSSTALYISPFPCPEGNAGTMFADFDLLNPFPQIKISLTFAFHYCLSVFFFFLACHSFIIIGKHCIFSVQKNTNPICMLEVKYHYILFSR